MAADGIDRTVEGFLLLPFFTVEEAATYMCISISHFRAQVQPEFPPGQFKGKLIYRRADVQRYLEKQALDAAPIPQEMVQLLVDYLALLLRFLRLKYIQLPQFV